MTGEGRVVVTWNLQGVSVREQTRARLRRVFERIRIEGWEIMCVTELRAEREGVVVVVVYLLAFFY